MSKQMSKKNRIAIQKETINFVNRNKYKFKSKTKKYDNIPYHSGKTFHKTNIMVSPMDTLEASIFYQNKYGKPFAFLVMANDRNPGGGYKTGSPAQEESICRRTNLVQCFNTVSYPISEFGCVYVKGVHIFRNLENNGYQFFKKHYVTDCIMSAAYNNPETDSKNRLLPKFEEGTRKKVHNMLNCFLENGNTNIILGAYGCGAFFNPPEHIVELFVKILNSDRYKNRFENVIFAILGGSWKKNYNTFKNIIG